MTEKERKTVSNIVDIINGELNRMCITADLAEFDTMYQHALKNLDRMAKIIYDARFATHHGMESEGDT